MKLWDMRGRLIKTLFGHDSWVLGLSSHPGGRYLPSGGDDCTFRCWDLSQGGRMAKILNRTHRGFVSCIRWAPEIAGSETNEGDYPALGLLRMVGTGSTDSGVRIFK